MSNRRPSTRDGAARSRAAQQAARAQSDSRAGGSRFASEMFYNLRQNTYLVSIFLMIVFGAISLAPQFQLWFEMRQKVSDAKAQVEAIRNENKTLKSDKNRWEDPVYVRSQARDRLFYVLPGEISYLVVGADSVNPNDLTGTLGEQLAAQRKTSQISQSLKQTNNNWVANLVESGVRAGLETPKN